jgi:predicted amidophosphoribosyltransferase
MQCPRCQQENPAQSNFCLNCGTRLGPACQACGGELPAGSSFCNKCGTPVKPAAPAASKFGSPEAYTPKHLAEKIPPRPPWRASASR